MLNYHNNNQEKAIINPEIKTVVFYLDHDGCCRMVDQCSDGWKTLAKLTYGRLFVREGTVSELNLSQYIVDHERTILQEHIQRCLKTQQPVISELHLQAQDGTTQRVQITSIPQTVYPVQEGLLTIMHDMNYHQDLKDVFSRLEELNLVGKIAGSVAHEVRNPLTVVRGHLQLLSWDRNLEKYNNQLSTMITEIDRAVEILTELLYMSRPSETRTERVNINDILNQLYQLLNAEALVNLHEVIYELEEVPDVMLDKKRFRQVVLNLLNNGLQAMENHNKIIIRTYANEGKVHFSIRDHGKGIPPEVLKKLGTPFVTTKANGTGLGLAACYNIIQEHQAKMEIDTGSEGTTFTIIFDAIA